MRHLLIGLLWIVSAKSIAQNVGIGTETPDASARLDIVATDKGLLVPRINIPLLKNPAPVVSPATGLIVYNTNSSTGPGLVHWNGAEWLPVLEPDDAWLTTGNNASSGFPVLGTKSNKPLIFIMNNSSAGYIDSFRTYLGFRAGISGGSSSYNNIAIGNGALEYNETGYRNVAIGSAALANNMATNNLVAIGDSALHLNTTGVLNTAVGYQTLKSNSTGSMNTALGYAAMRSRTSGDMNTAIGYGAMTGNLIGQNNIAIGALSLSQSKCSNSIAIGNFTLMYNRANGTIAIGDSALFLNGISNSDPALSVENMAIGNKVLWNSRTGNTNLAIGYETMFGNTTGNSNLAIGKQALYNVLNTHNNVSIGHLSGYANTGSNNIFIGNNAGQNAQSSNKLYIENSSADSLSALIYGDFQGDSLCLNAKTIIRNQLGVRGSAGTTGIELGYGVAGKESNAGRMGYALFTSNAVDIVGGGTQASSRVIRFWAEGGSRFTGKVVPDADNAFLLGESGKRWSAVWAANGTIQTSDARLKTQIRASEYGLKELLQLRPVQYHWKANPNAAPELGFLAQDVQQLIPEAVVDPGNGDPLGMKYAELIPVLTRAIQEQQEEINLLKAELKNLRQKQ